MSIRKHLVFHLLWNASLFCYLVGKLDSSEVEWPFGEYLITTYLGLEGLRTSLDLQGLGKKICTAGKPKSHHPQLEVCAVSAAKDLHSTRRSTHCRLRAAGGFRRLWGQGSRALGRQLLILSSQTLSHIVVVEEMEYEQHKRRISVLELRYGLVILEPDSKEDAPQGRLGLPRS